MNEKSFFQRVWNAITDAWNKGVIQRTSRITYDVVWNIILFFIIVAMTVTVFGVGVGAGYFASLVKDEPIRDYDSMKKDIYNYEETSKLYFAGDKYIGDIRADLHREEIDLDDTSDILLQAVVSTEDQLFYEHNGVVPKAIVRAIYQEAMNSDTKTGGSTLTQQLIKNQILTNEVSFERKAKEILLAMRLEHFFEKDEILEAYLNIIPYGRNASGKNIAGIQTASQGVFGVDAKDLSIPQAAFLAGIPKNPYAYTPFINNGEVKDEDGLAPGKQRMQTVLKRMYKDEVITEAEYNEAAAYDIEADFTDKKNSTTEKYPAVVDELESRAKKILMEQIAEEDGITMEDLDADDDLKENYKQLADRALRRNGYHIHSTINKKMYDAMEKVGKDYDQYGPDRTFKKDGEEKTDIVDAGAVLIENKTGRILTFYPGRKYEVGGNVFNYATQAYRQPGSTFKPLATYGPALDLGKAQPGSVIADVPTPSGHPNNFSSGVFYGLVSAREALANSYNVTAHYVYSSIMGDNPRKNYLEKMGFQLDEERDTGPSLGIGGTTNGVTVEQNVNAFSTFGNGGKYEASYMIEKITDSNGNTIYEHESDPVEVFSPRTSYLMVDMMRDVIRQGTAAAIPPRLQHGGVDWAGKTGTSNSYEDSWFVGTNPNVTFGTWIGYDTPHSIYCPGCSLGYAERNQYLWTNFVNALTEIDADLMAPQYNFKQPDGIVSRSYCATSGLIPSKICNQAGLARSDIYNADFVPNKEDYSLIGGDMPLVEIDGEQYFAHDKTPSEFTTEEKGGFVFNQEWIEDNGYDRLGDLSQLIPRKNAESWKKISAATGESSVTDEEIGEDNGKNPPQPSKVSMKNQELTWKHAKNNLIVGYRIFRSDKDGGSKQLVGSTKNPSFKIGDKAGVYVVKAVNYFGRESPSSNSVKIKDKNKDKNKNEDKDKNTNKDKDKNNNNNDNNNDNNDSSDNNDDHNDNNHNNNNDNNDD